MNKHGKACKDYKEHFLDEHSYPYCEICSRSDQAFDTHHLYPASLHPHHKALHDFRNLILVCRSCHSKLHARGLKDVFAKLEEERGLVELFM